MPVGANRSLEQVIRLAVNEAVEAGCPQISPAHLLIALARVCDLAESPDAAARQGLQQEFASLGIDPKTFRRRYRAILGKGNGNSNHEDIEPSSHSRALMVAAEQVASGSGVPVTPVTLLRAVFASLGDIGSGTAQKADMADDIPHEL